VGGPIFFFGGIISQPNLVWDTRANLELPAEFYINN
jgi:hypothetical protein